MAALLKTRCALYTRTSNEEGLRQDYNSNHAQRDACESWIVSQKAEGLTALPAKYDDLGFSGGSLERPALTTLRADIAAGKVDLVVLYKIDRLSRSLFDFAKLVEEFERSGVKLVSVTQPFNTTSPMGRLTLNMLLSFAQFEREQIGERIRDKVAASRARGIWMGGSPPLGYHVVSRKLVIHEKEAILVQRIFNDFNKGGSISRLAKRLSNEGQVTKAGKPIYKTYLYKLLHNRVYIGEAVHKDKSYPGEHQAIIERKTWDKAHQILQTNGRARAGASRRNTPALLKGLVYGPSGLAMTPTHTRREGRIYRYYVSTSVLKEASDACPLGRVPAAELERAVIDQVRKHIVAPDVVVRTWRAARKSLKGISESDVRKSLRQFDEIWDELFPAEQSRILQLIVARVEVALDELSIHMRTDGLSGLVGSMSGEMPA